MKKYKLFALLLCLVLASAALTACGGGASESATETTAASESASTQEATVAMEAASAAVGEVIGDTLKWDPNVPVNNGEDITVSFWVPASWESYYRKWTDAYREFHPNVTFEFSITSFDDHWKKVPMAMQSDSGPDMFWMHNSVNEIMIPHMEPLPVDKFPVEDVAADFLQVESNLIDGKLYYIDLGLMTGVIFYNLDLWADAGLTDADIPATWDELIEVAKKLTVTDDAGNMQVAGFNTNNAEYIWVDMMYQQGKWLFDEAETTAQFQSPEGLKAAQLMYDMYNTHNIGAGTQPKGEEAFANGQAAMIYCWGWASNYFKTNFPDLNYGAFALPTFDPNAPAYGRNNGDVSLGVSKYPDDDVKAVCLDFVKYQMCNDEMLIEYDVFDGMAPTKISLANHPSIQEEPVLKVQSEMLSKTIWPGAAPDAYLAGVQKYVGQSVLMNATDPAAALEEAQRMVNQELSNMGFVSKENLTPLADQFTYQTTAE